MPSDRLVKTTNWSQMRKWTDEGRKCHMVLMGPDGRVPVAWWFEPAARAKARKAAQRRIVTGLERDLRKAKRSGTA